ncbi:MAG: class I SAM-dependent methyltransferase [Bacteroidetes bacterium]|nr:class I SAM-dependent methyltransferase [Bacteroidota bacterium]
MQYDPIKNSFGSIIRGHSLFRKVFYKILGIFFLREWYVKRELRRILKHHHEPFVVYDAGCGFGQYSYYIAKKFPNISIVAVDLKEEYIRDCTEFFHSERLMNCQFGVEDLTSIAYVDTFDCIISIDVMEHIHDDQKVFHNFFRALKKGGILLITTPSLQGGSDVHTKGEESFIGEHARTGYGNDEMREKLRNAGFSDVSIQYTYGVWGMRAWRCGIKIPLMLVNKSKVFFAILPFYYCFIFPFFFVSMLIDYNMTKHSGAGLLVLAKKI